MTDNTGYLIVATIANNLGEHKWEEEWRQFYDPTKWLGSHRAAAAFLTEKMQTQKEALKALIHVAETMSAELDLQSEPHELTAAKSLCS